MKNTDERLLAVHNRVKEIKRERTNQQNRLIIAAAGAVSLVLLIALVTSLPRTISGLSAVEFTGSERLGSIFYNSDMLSYILIAFLSFLLGVSFTLLSVFLHKRNKNDNNQ